MTIVEEMLLKLLGQEVFIFNDTSGILRFDPAQNEYYLEGADFTSFPLSEVDTVEGRHIILHGNFLTSYYQGRIDADRAELWPDGELDIDFPPWDPGPSGWG
jgi:hypothetical protein